VLKPARRAIVKEAVLLAILILGSAGQPLPATAQSDEDLKALRREIEALREGQSAIQRQLQELTDLLRGRQPQAAAEPTPVTLGVEGAPFEGDRAAKVTVVEFSDYQCPFCRRHFDQTWPQILAEYVKAGKVKYVFRDFPIESIHPQAFKAAEAARCAGEQGRYWEMHDRLFSNPDHLGLADLPGHAAAIALDATAFQQCLDSGKQADGIRADLADGLEAGITGTPTFFLGLTDTQAPTLKVLSRLVGAQPFPAFKQAIDSLLSDGE
jgi:protein-disulfide isomerase